MIDLKVIPRERVEQLWPLLLPGIETYRRKSPHLLESEDELLAYLQSQEGDELALILSFGTYAGFLTFKVQPFDGEIWGTIAMIFVTAEGQAVDALPEACRQLEQELRDRGATLMNYMTARKGFGRLAPRLGFRPRIIEWMKEL
jgi:hypothetical protein